MKVICILAVFFAAALAAPQGDVQILSSEFENIGIDGYKFAYVKSLKKCLKI
jgi:hypothetical protein